MEKSDPNPNPNPNPNPTPTKPQEGEEDEERSRKRKERLEQNRISARESRKRKKNMIEELQRTVITLSRENKELNERNESLRHQLMEIGTKYPSIVPVQAIVGGTRQNTSTTPNTSTQEAGQYDQNGQGKPSSGNPQQEAQQQKPDVVPDNKS